MSEKSTRNLHPERVRPKVAPREVSLGGKAMAGYSFSPNHGNRVMTGQEATQRHLEQLVLHGQEEVEPEFTRKGDKPSKYEIDANPEIGECDG